MAKKKRVNRGVVARDYFIDSGIQLRTSDKELDDYAEVHGINIRPRRKKR